MICMCAQASGNYCVKQIIKMSVNDLTILLTSESDRVFPKVGVSARASAQDSLKLISLRSLISLNEE